MRFTERIKARSKAGDETVEVPELTAYAKDKFHIELEPLVSESPEQMTWKDVPLPFADRESAGIHFKEEKIPERIRQMRRLNDFGSTSAESRAKNFYRQAKYMEDYEDDAPWKGSIVCYFPTYRDLTTRQLRGYFAWRTDIRRDIWRPIALSAAYIYVYELLNGIGAASPEDSLQKLKTFTEKYINSGFGESRMRGNVSRWAMELAIISGLPQAVIQEYMEPELRERDGALIALQNSAEHTDEEIISALCFFGGKKLAQSPVLSSAGERGRHLFAQAWRIAAEQFSENDKDLFAVCFGNQITRRWYPLSNAVYYRQNRPEDTEYQMNTCRTYICRDGAWQVKAYEKLTFDKDKIRGFLHTTDLLLRRYLKTGRYLREKPEDSWAVPFVQMVIRADEQALIEAARPKITIDLSGLEQIRRDALETQNSLLTEEDIELKDTQAEAKVPAVPEPEYASKGQKAAAEVHNPAEPEPVVQESAMQDTFPELPLDAAQIRILQMLLKNESPDAFIREQHLMPSLVADTVNEALFVEIGDAVLMCEEDQLSIVEDYTEELAELLGGIHDS